MTWIIQHKSPVRIGIFALLLIAILGPWGYEYDNVLLAEKSSKPFLLVRVCLGVRQKPNICYPSEQLEFTWEGQDENDPVLGSGWLMFSGKDKLKGKSSST